MALPPTTVLLLEDGDIRQGNPLLEALRAKATVQAFRRLSVRDIEGWIGERARRRGVLFESAALRLLAESVPTEAADDRQWHGLWGVAAEIEKLSLYAAGERITEQDVRRLTAAALESRAYLLADKVMERRAGEALAVLEELLAGGRPVAVLLSTIATRVRQLILLRYLSEQRVPRGEIQQRLAVRSDWQFDRLHEQAMRLPLPRLEAAHERLLDTDRAIKSGRMDETTAIEILVAELSS
ncbi:MAG: DNA polymerase III subunit delta [Dehalococcoidia bacterium]